MRASMLAAVLLSALAAAASPARAQETVREGLEVMDEIGVAVRGVDGDAAAVASRAVLQVGFSVRLIVPGQHGVGLGFDMGFDVSGDPEAIHFYGLDLFYIHPWAFEEHWEVTPLFGISCGWADATLTTCTTDCNDEQKIRMRELDRIDSFMIGGRIGFSVDYVVEFIHMGLTATVRLMAATGEDPPFQTYWQQSLLLRAGFRFDL